ncbi:hypothetical protein BC830DRAFT_1088317 [Chytriomyces sp. MP71]|nr:hypothetical protein BC830DRAFT_1088317 [Chytriomyces sp. MP71]
MRIRLNEVDRRVSLEIPRFSVLASSGSNAVVSYGATPFLVCGRKWGLNVYPNGHNASQQRRRIDVYVFVHARDGRESEAQFLTWLQRNKVYFELVVSEPPPAVLHATYASHNHWAEMEDSAGWFYFGLEAPAPLLDLTNDTLKLDISFREGPSPPIPSSDRNESLVAHGEAWMKPVRLNSTPQAIDLASLYPLFPSANYEPAMEILLDNHSLSDFIFIAEDNAKAIHIHTAFLRAKVPAWTPKPSSNLVNTTPCYTGGGISAQKPLPRQYFLDTPYPVLHSFLAFIYSGRLPLLERKDTAFDVYVLGHLLLLSEQFGAHRLRRFLLRRFYTSVTTANAVEMLVAFGGRSDAIQEVAAFVLCRDFASVREGGAFTGLVEACVSESITKEEKCVATKRLLAVLRRLKAGEVVVPAGALERQNSTESDEPRSVLSMPVVDDGGVNVEGPPAPPALDPRRTAAFRMLLCTPAVADVQFDVDGRVLYAQKCVLSLLSDFFAAMFRGGWNEGGLEAAKGNISVVHVTDFPYDTFRAMLNYLYLQELDPNLTLTSLGRLHICADKYQISDLAALTLRLISTSLNPSNVATFLFGFAGAHDALGPLGLGYMVAHWDEVRGTREFAGAVRRAREFPGAFCSEGVLMKVLRELKGCDFERVGFLLEESGGVDEFIEPIGDDEEPSDKVEVRGGLEPDEDWPSTVEENEVGGNGHVSEVDDEFVDPHPGTLMAEIHAAQDTI